MIEIQERAEFSAAIAMRLFDAEFAEFAMFFAADHIKGAMYGAMFIMTIPDHEFVYRPAVSFKRAQGNGKLTVAESAVVFTVSFYGEAVTDIVVLEVNSDVKLSVLVTVRTGDFKIVELTGSESRSAEGHQ